MDEMDGEPPFHIFVVRVRTAKQEDLGRGRVREGSGTTQPDKILSELPVTSRLARNLSALLKISRIVHSIRDLDELQQQILNLIFEISPAEQGAILLDGKGVDHLESVFARNRPPGNAPPCNGNASTCAPGPAVICPSASP